MDYEDQTQLGSEVDELEELASELGSVPTDDSAPPITSPADAREEAEEEAELATEFAGSPLSFDMTDRAQELRSHSTVQKVVADIRSVRSADEIAELLKSDPTQVPQEIIAEAKLDYMIVEHGDTSDPSVVGTPMDVASAVWAELHAGQPTSQTPTPPEQTLPPGGPEAGYGSTGL